MDVWQNNLDIEMAKIRSIVQQYPYIAMVNFLPVFTVMYDCHCFLRYTISDMYRVLSAPHMLLKGVYLSMQ